MKISLKDQEMAWAMNLLLEGAGLTFMVDSF